LPPVVPGPIIPHINLAAGFTPGITARQTGSKEKQDVETYFDETDLGGISTGCPATVVFDALPKQTFSGLISQVAPALLESNGQKLVLGNITLDSAGTLSALGLPLGANTSTDVTCTRAKNAILLAVEALNQDAGGQYTVSVLNPDGTIEKRVVEIGAQDLTSAEIRSGLSEGEQVIIGDVET
jgi:multidrug efflux pump subunit AcrA (membrane-fusion protein)